MTPEANQVLGLAKGYNEQNKRQSFVRKMIEGALGGGINPQQAMKINKRLADLFDADASLKKQESPQTSVFEEKMNEIMMASGPRALNDTSIASNEMGLSGTQIPTGPADMYESPQGFTQAIPPEVMRAMNGGLAAFSPNQRMQQGLMQTYRPPVRMMVNGGGVEMPLEQELSQRNMYSDIYKDLTGYYGKERDEKIFNLAKNYNITPGEVLNAYQEGSNMTETRPVPQGTSEDYDPVDIPEGRSSFLNFVEQLVGPTAYGVGESAIDAVTDNVVDPVIQYAGDRLEAISPENRGTLGQDIFDKILTPQEDGGSTDPNYIDPNSAYAEMIRGASTAPVDPSNIVDPASPQAALAYAQMNAALVPAVVDPNNIDPNNSEAIADSNLNGYLSDKSAVGRAVMDLEGSRRRAALEAGADPTIQQSPFDRALDFAKKTFAGDSEEINIEDLAEELDDYFKQSVYETSSSQQRNESSPQRIMIGKLGPERQGRLARAIAAGEEFKTAESIDEFFKDDEGYEELAAAAKGAAAKGAAADEEKKDKDADAEVKDADAEVKKVVAPDGAVKKVVAPNGAVKKVVAPVLPTRKPAPPKLQQAAMDAVASGSVDSFLGGLSQKDLLAMAVGFLGATSVTAGTKAALANLLKSKEAAEALKLAGRKLDIQQSKVDADTGLLAYKYAALARDNGITATALAGVLNKNPLFAGDLAAYMAAGYGTLGHDQYIGPYRQKDHFAAQQKEATRVAKQINQATGRSGSTRVPAATGAPGGIKINPDGSAT